MWSMYVLWVHTDRLPTHGYYPSYPFVDPCQLLLNLGYLSFGQDQVKYSNWLVLDNIKILCEHF